MKGHFITSKEIEKFHNYVVGGRNTIQYLPTSSKKGAENRTLV